VGKDLLVIFNFPFLIFHFSDAPNVSLAFSNPLIAKTNPAAGSARVPACPLAKICLAWIKNIVMHRVE